MPSFTEELLGETFKQIDTGFKELALKLDVTKLEVPVSAINNVFFLRIENSLKTLVFRTALIEASGQVRQERKQAMLRELYDSKVVADLVKARDLRAELDRLFQDLESFKAKALRDEQMGKMGLSSFELLTLSARRIKTAHPGSGIQQSRVEKTVHVKEHWRRRPTRKQKGNTSKAK